MPEERKKSFDRYLTTRGEESNNSAQSEGIVAVPMKFGSRNQFKIALTELKWTRQVKGEISKQDYAMIAEKYGFPVEFLMEFPNDLTFPDDYHLSKSKWYPILYSWRAYEKECSINLFRLQFDYERTKFMTILYLVFLVIGFMYIDTILQQLLQIDLLQRLSIIVLPLALSIVALIVEFRNNVSEKKLKVDEYSADLEKQGLSNIIETHQKFIGEHYKDVVYAGHILLRKFQEAPMISGFYVGTNEQTKQQTHRQVLLKKLHLIPKSSKDKREIIPIFNIENVDIEYKKRIHELEKEKQDKTS